ncbi:MAG: 50S ribosomal protein L28 [Candidatus Scalinduaceae bacterium]
MSRRCEICGKGTTVGYQIKRRGLAKRKGGVGRKITGRTKRKFKANIQTLRANLDGSIRKMKVCTRCMNSGKVIKVI